MRRHSRRCTVTRPSPARTVLGPDRGPEELVVTCLGRSAYRELLNPVKNPREPDDLGVAMAHLS